MTIKIWYISIQDKQETESVIVPSNEEGFKNIKNIRLNLIIIKYYCEILVLIIMNQNVES